MLIQYELFSISSAFVFPFAFAFDQARRGEASLLLIGYYDRLGQGCELSVW